jgi:hypothetical protein
MKSYIKKSIVLASCFIGSVFIIQSCSDTTTPPAPTNEEELITTLKIELTDTFSHQVFSYFFRDPDGEGANAPTQWDTIILDPNRAFTANVKFLNESNPNAVVNITDEIKKEQENHIVCYEVSNANLTVTRTDSAGVFLLGLSSKWESGLKSNGDLTVTLKHQPGIKDGSCNPGATDVEVKFPVKVR